MRNVQVPPELKYPTKSGATGVADGGVVIVEETEFVVVDDLLLPDRADATDAADATDLEDFADISRTCQLYLLAVCRK
jgi:hypothetical protein